MNYKTSFTTADSMTLRETKNTS